ncbi:hypothetical protein ES708_34524 [subsurface metagenome]
MVHDDIRRFEPLLDVPGDSLSLHDQGNDQGARLRHNPPDGLEPFRLGGYRINHNPVTTVSGKGRFQNGGIIAVDTQRSVRCLLHHSHEPVHDRDGGAVRIPAVAGIDVDIIRPRLCLVSGKGCQAFPVLPGYGLLHRRDRRIDLFSDYEHMGLLYLSQVRYG